MKQDDDVMPRMALAALLWGLTSVPFIAAEAAGWLPEKWALPAWGLTSWLLLVAIVLWFAFQKTPPAR